MLIFSDAGVGVVSSTLFSTFLLLFMPLPIFSTATSSVSGLEVAVFSRISLEVAFCLETLVKASRARGLLVDAFFVVAADTFRRLGAGIFEG